MEGTETDWIDALRDMGIPSLHRHHEALVADIVHWLRERLHDDMTRASALTVLLLRLIFGSPHRIMEDWIRWYYYGATGLSTSSAATADYHLAPAENATGAATTATSGGSNESITLMLCIRDWMEYLDHDEDKGQESFGYVLDQHNHNSNGNNGITPNATDLNLAVPRIVADLERLEEEVQSVCQLYRAFQSISKTALSHSLGQLVTNCPLTRYILAKTKSPLRLQIYSRSSSHPEHNALQLQLWKLVCHVQPFIPPSKPIRLAPAVAWLLWYGLCLVERECCDSSTHRGAEYHPREKNYFSHSDRPTKRVRGERPDGSLIAAIARKIRELILVMESATPLTCHTRSNAEHLCEADVEVVFRKLVHDMIYPYTNDSPSQPGSLEDSLLILQHFHNVISKVCRSFLNDDKWDSNELLFLMHYEQDTGNDPVNALMLHQGKTDSLSNAVQSNRLAYAMKLAVQEADKLFISDSKIFSFTETMELTEWTVSLLIADLVQPSRQLRMYVDAVGTSWRETIIPTVNRVLLRLSQEGAADKATRTAPVSVSMDNSCIGVVHIHGDVTPDKQLCKAVVALYYHALEAVLRCQATRPDNKAHPRILLRPVFHRALLACACWCVTKTLGMTQKLRATPSLQALPLATLLRRVTESNPYDFLKVSDVFVRSLITESSRDQLDSPLIVHLPRLLVKDLNQVEANVCDALLWSTSMGVGRDGSILAVIEDFQERSNSTLTFWPVEALVPNLREEVESDGPPPTLTYPTEACEDYPEYQCVNFILRRIIKTAFMRLEAFCNVLQVAPNVPLATQSWVAFRYLLRTNPKLLLDRHVDHFLLCCLYSVSKVMQFSREVTFAAIIDAYIAVRGPDIGDITCQRIVRFVKIENGRTEAGIIDTIITFYNRVFVPAMKEYLLLSVSLKRCSTQVAGDLPNQC